MQHYIKIGGGGGGSLHLGLTWVVGGGVMMAAVWWSGYGCGGGYGDRLGFGKEEENGSGRGKKSPGIASELTYFLRKEELLFMWLIVVFQAKYKWNKRKSLKS